MSIAENLCRLRQAKGLTQGAVAGEVGIGRDSLRRYENDKRVPNKDALDRLSLFYGVSPSDITGDSRDAEVRYLKGLRLGLGITSAEVCERTGFKLKTFKNWERGDKGIGFDSAERLARFYKVPLAEFLEKTAIVKEQDVNLLSAKQAGLPANTQPKVPKIKLSALRLAEGLSMADVARAIGLQEEAIRRHEEGISRPSSSVIVALTQLYSITATELEQYLKPDIRREKMRSHGRVNNYVADRDLDIDGEPQTPVEELLRLESYEDWKAKRVGA